MLPLSCWRLRLEQVYNFCVCNTENMSSKHQHKTIYAFLFTYYTFSKYTDISLMFALR